MRLKVIYIVDIKPETYLEIKTGLEALKLKIHTPRIVTTNTPNPSQVYCNIKLNNKDEAEDMLTSIKKINGVLDANPISKWEPDNLSKPVFLSS